MKKYLFIILFIVTKTSAQELFLKTYDFGTVENSYQILSYEGRIYINTATICDFECSYLTEIDSTGAILWRTEIPDIDIASGTMVIANDTITVTGNNDPFNTAFRMAHFTLDGEKLGPTIEIEHPTKKYTRMFQLTTQYFNGKFAVCGPGVQKDTSWSLIYVVNTVGELDTLIALEPTNHESDIWDSYIDKDGNLTTYHWVEFGHPGINYRKIIKFDANFDTVWTYSSELLDNYDVIPHGCELDDGRTILSFVHPQGSLIVHSVRCINQDGSIDWQHNYNLTGSKTRYIVTLKTLNNGDIMGCGAYSELAQIPKINSSPWLFRMSPDGVLLWEHTYVEIDTNDMESRRGPFFDFIELENGDIMAVGYFQYEDDDMLIMRVDSNGCLNPENCQEVNVLTKNEELLFALSDFELYPNPVETSLNILTTGHNGKIDFKIFDIRGKQILNGFIINEASEIKTDNLASGIYNIHLYEKGRLLASKMFVKMSKNR